MSDSAIDGAMIELLDDLAVVLGVKVEAGVIVVVFEEEPDVEEAGSVESDTYEKVIPVPLLQTEGANDAFPATNFTPAHFPSVHQQAEREGRSSFCNLPGTTFRLQRLQSLG